METPNEKERILAELKKRGWRDMTWLPGVFYHVYQTQAVKQPIRPVFWDGEVSPTAPSTEKRHCAILVFDERDLDNLINTPEQLAFMLNANSNKGVHTLILLTGETISHGYNYLPLLRFLLQIHHIFLVHYDEKIKDLMVSEYDIFKQERYDKAEILRLKHGPYKWADSEFEFTEKRHNYKDEVRDYHTLRLNLKVDAWEQRTHTGGAGDEWFSNATRYTWQTSYSGFTGPFGSTSTRNTHSQQRAAEEEMRRTRERMARDFEEMLDRMYRASYTSAASPSPAPVPTPKLTDWLHWRSVFENCRTAEDAQKTFRAAMIEHHPDKGGDSEVSKAVTRAWAAYKKNNKRR